MTTSRLVEIKNIVAKRTAWRSLRGGSCGCSGEVDIQYETTIEVSMRFMYEKRNGIWTYALTQYATRTTLSSRLRKWHYYYFYSHASPSPWVELYSYTKIVNKVER